MEEFLFNLPKLELHAHLNGSLGLHSIRELGEALHGSNSPEFLELCRKFVDFEGTDLAATFQKFKFLHDLTSTRKGLYLATEMVVRDFALDNVIYLELRTTPKARGGEMSKLQYMECVMEAVKSAQEKMPNIHVKLLPSIDRGQPVAEAKETLDIALQLRDKYPGIIVGLDFSGNPYQGRFSDFKATLQLAKEQGLKLSLHCAENSNEEAEEMLDFGMDRCGHGTFLSDAQMQEIHGRDIAIECCLTSNVKCATVLGYGDHHFKRFFERHKSAVVLCTDDCGVFDTTLTKEFLLAEQHFQLSVEDFMHLSVNAVRHSFADDNTKERTLAAIEKYFSENSVKLTGVDTS